MAAQVTDTAAAVAQIRADEGRLPAEERLFEDPFADLFAAHGHGPDVTEQFLRFPFFREQVRLRTRFLDDVVRERIADDVRQLLILGAGFDCRSLRMSEIRESDCRVFEVDLPEQIRAKREVLERHRVAIPSLLAFVAADFTYEGWDVIIGRDLERAGFEPRHRALFLLEGVISYLDPPDIRRVLAWMAGAAAAGSSAAFNYNLARADPETIRSYASEGGFRSLQDHRFDRLFTRYLGGTPPPGGELFHVAVAQT